MTTPAAVPVTIHSQGISEQLQQELDPDGVNSMQFFVVSLNELDMSYFASDKRARPNLATSWQGNLVVCTSL